MTTTLKPGALKLIGYLTTPEAQVNQALSGQEALETADKQITDALAAF